MIVSALVISILALYTKIVVHNTFWSFVLAIISFIFAITKINRTKKGTEQRAMVVTSLILVGILILIFILPIIPCMVSNLFDLISHYYFYYW